MERERHHRAACYRSARNCSQSSYVLVMEKNPWWKNVSGPFTKWEGPIGCKADGGGNHYGRGKVGKMIIHRAVHNKEVAGAYQSSSS